MKLCIEFDPSTTTIDGVIADLRIFCGHAADTSKVTSDEMLRGDYQGSVTDSVDSPQPRES